VSVLSNSVVRGYCLLTSSVSSGTDACLRRFCLRHDVAKSAVVEFALWLTLGLGDGEVDWDRVALLMRSNGFDRVSRRRPR
jgi:hypothetical protein